jgi:hypothetical protein
MEINEKNHNVYIANQGKVFKCKYNNIIIGKYLCLNKINNGNYLEDDVIDNYEEIDEPEVNHTFNYIK